MRRPRPVSCTRRGTRIGKHRHGNSPGEHARIDSLVLCNLRGRSIVDNILNQRGHESRSIHRRFVAGLFQSRPAHEGRDLHERWDHQLVANPLNLAGRVLRIWIRFDDDVPIPGSSARTNQAGTGNRITWTPGKRSARELGRIGAGEARWWITRIVHVPDDLIQAEPRLLKRGEYLRLRLVMLLRGAQQSEGGAADYEKDAKSSQQLNEREALLTSRPGRLPHFCTMVSRVMG